MNVGQPGWSNGKIEFVDLKIGQVVDYVGVAPVSCPVLVGEPKWHVLMTAPQGEKKIVEDLVQAGFRSRYFKVWRNQPTGQRDAKGHRISVQRERAMFPGYVFADLREGRHDFKEAVSVKGVRDFLRRDGRPCVVPLVDFYDMEKAENDEYQRYLISSRPKPRVRDDLAVGELVRAPEDNALFGFSATIAALNDNGRVKLLLSMFGRETPVWVDGDTLEKV